MGIEYYVFALFVFILICGVIFLYKKLFSSVKQEKLSLEEKETKLLRLYQTVEDAMDEFYDLVEESKAEIREDHKRISALTAGLSKKLEAPVPELKKAVPLQADKKPIPIGEFQKALEEAAAASEIPDEPEERTTSRVQTDRNVKILELSGKGIPRAEVAKQLGITQNEVDLVIEMNKP